MKVSVCIPTYNQSAYIEQAIRSAVNQTLKPFEIIVSDDCSTDNTRNLLKQLESEIPQLKILNQPVNIGVARNTDVCLRAASGDYIVRLDSDDFLLADYIKTLTDLMNKHPNAGYAHSDVKEIDINGDFIKERKLMRNTGFLDAESALKASLKGYKVAANIILFRRSVLEEVGYVSANVNFVEDYYLSVKIAEKGYGNVYFSGFLSCYRVWVSKGMVKHHRKMDEIIGYRRIFEDLMEPAFQQRGWKMSIIKKSRANFACGNAVCLTWEQYSDDEKKQLLTELYLLSSAWQTKLVTWLYMHKNGFILKMFSNIKSFLKYNIKKIIVK